ncbi:MAG: 3'-5' exonuclease [bacterium]|nr:3'-5' exonuclease [bacterium]MDZ4231222.1 3'-5' exonuclease [Patescibacteria group bacterium]
MEYRYFENTIRGRDICFFDLESTSLSAYGEILEIGALRVETDAFNVMEEFNIKVLPQRIEVADPAALEISGYNEELWAKEGIESKEALARFMDFAEGSILSAHNLPMDWMWLQRNLEDVGLNPSHVYSGIDTVGVAWTVFHRKGINAPLSLGKLADYFDIDRGQAHRALDDARTAYKVFVKLLELDAKD